LFSPTPTLYTIIVTDQTIFTCIDIVYRTWMNALHRGYRRQPCYVTKPGKLSKKMSWPFIKQRLRIIIIIFYTTCACAVQCDDHDHNTIRLILTMYIIPIVWDW